MRQLAAELHIAASDFELPVTALSGGNQQKVLLARCLMCSPSVLLMDEPTRGVDVGAKAEIYRILRELAAKGLSIIFTSSEIEETQMLAGRVLVLCQGRISAEFQFDELSDEGFFAAASPPVASPAQDGNAAVSTIAETLSNSDRLTTSSARFVLLLLRARAILVLVLLLVLFSSLAPGFMTVNNLSILTKHVAISGDPGDRNDLRRSDRRHRSFRRLYSGAGRDGGGLSSSRRESYLAAPRTFRRLTIAILFDYSCVCMLVGALNGWLVAKAGVAPFIATLGTLYISRGAALLISNGKTFPNLAGMPSRDNTGSPSFGQSFLLHVPTPVWMMVVLFAWRAVVATKTPFGRHVYAIGGNERAARLAGIRVAHVKLQRMSSRRSVPPVWGSSSRRNSRRRIRQPEKPLS